MSHLHTGTFNQDNFHSTIHTPMGHVISHNNKQKLVDKVDIFLWHQYCHTYFNFNYQIIIKKVNTKKIMCIIGNTHALFSHQNTMIFISLLPPAMRIRLLEKTLEIKWEDIGNYGAAILTSWAINNGTKTFVESQNVLIFLNKSVTEIMAIDIRHEDCKCKRAKLRCRYLLLLTYRLSIIIVCRPL